MAVEPSLRRNQETGCEPLQVRGGSHPRKARDQMLPGRGGKSCCDFKHVVGQSIGPVTPACFAAYWAVC